MYFFSDQIRENADKAYIMDHLVNRSLPANEGRCMHTRCSHEANTCDLHVIHDNVSVTSKIQYPFWNSRGLVLGETRSPYLLTNVLRLFSIESACYVWYIIRCVRTLDLRVPSEEAILFIDILNYRGLMLGEMRSLANVSWEQLTFWIGLLIYNDFESIWYMIFIRYMYFWFCNCDKINELLVLGHKINIASQHHQGQGIN